MSRIIYFLILIIFCTGCSPVPFIRGVIGNRIDHLDKCEKRYSKVYDMELAKAYSKLFLYLKDDKHILVYSKNKDKAIYARCFDKVFPLAIDTTDAGFYFFDEDDNKTKIEVTSLNSELARFLSMEFIDTVFAASAEEK